MCAIALTWHLAGYRVRKLVFMCIPYFLSIRHFYYCKYSLNIYNVNGINIYEISGFQGYGTV
jgi:hypothetical protein